MTPAIGYLGRPTGPIVGAELLCPACGGLLALGWEPGPEAVAALGASLPCRLCRLHVPVDARPCTVAATGPVRPYWGRDCA